MAWDKEWKTSHEKTGALRGKNSSESDTYYHRLLYIKQALRKARKNLIPKYIPVP